MRTFSRILLNGAIIAFAAGVSAQDTDFSAKMKNAEEKMNAKQYSEAVKIYERIIADPTAKENTVADARFNRIDALSRDSSHRSDYLKAAEEFVSSQDAPLDRKSEVFGRMINTYIGTYGNRDWENATACLRRYAELPGLAPARKASVLLQLGDIRWRECHDLEGSLKALRAVVAIPEAPAKTKQDAETWIRMLTEPY